MIQRGALRSNNNEKLVWLGSVATSYPALAFRYLLAHQSAMLSCGLPRSVYRRALPPGTAHVVVIIVASPVLLAGLMINRIQRDA
jgi:hypothetical protein